ncbi:DIS3-like exonuclease 2 [Rhynchospora pubera]|uniref:DIS3-like exonuclease 2 n=1 Tax=Rhynchospora pubera TaxID=906938 RepID=A0AAV8HGV3_9POAL|nr:DIS3-like exonuclease 2 [Rhynchospora pubera]
MRSIGDNGASMAAEEAEKDRRRRRRNRPYKKNTSPAPEGALGNLMDSICGPPPELSENGSGVLGAHPMYTTPTPTPTPLEPPEVTFNSLPPIHIFEDHASSSEVKGEEVSQISQSCPLPSTSYFTPVQSRKFRAVSREEKKKYFDSYWPDQAAEDAFKRGTAFKAKFRVNAHNRAEAYCTVDGLPVDVLINGIVAQNRAIEGDTVAITLDPITIWTKIKGANSPSKQGPEIGDSSSIKGTPISSTFQSNRNTCMTSTSLTTENGHDTRDSDTLDQIERVEKTDYGRALERIKAIITSNPTKRPTGRVVSIIKRSPRRMAVVGFFVTAPLLPEIEFSGKGADSYQGMTKKKKKKNDTISALHLVPNDPRLPKMTVSIDNLPGVARERVKIGDLTIKKELIAARLDEWNEESWFPVAQVVDVLGPGCEIETQIAAILFEHAIRSARFSQDLISCIPGPSWEIPEEEVTARRDLRSIITFTIDPPSAIELDDALSIEILPDGVFRIGVHIADVAYFVKPNSSLDKEAQVLSTSVYMVQHKLSMLPKELSQGCATLSPGLDRLAMSVIWDFDSNGNILDRWIGRSVIFSCCKLSYDLVQDVIDTGFGPSNLNGSNIPQVYGKYQWKDVVKSLESFDDLSQKLKEIRFREGALSLGNSKLAFLFDEGGLPYDSYRCDERIEACSLVEEFMLLANRSVAEVIASAFPDCALLRRHPEPNLRRLREFEVFCGRLGIELDASSSGQLHLSLSKIREKLKDEPFLFDIIVSYASKPMQPALYFCTGDLKAKMDEWGHYALSVPFYTHFTSPIRRYPDIIVHRTLLAVIDAEACLKRNDVSGNNNVEMGSFTGLTFDRKMAKSKEGKDALLGAAIKFRVPGVEVLGELAEYCNERKLASRHAEEAGQKVFLWALLKNKQALISEARVMGLGPKFMSVYVQKLACEKRIYYDEVEELAADWLESTETLVLDLYRRKPFQKKGTVSKYRPIEDVTLIENPSELLEEVETTETNSTELYPAVFPMVLRVLSSVHVALRAIGGDDGPIDIGVRLYASSYF